MKKAMKSLTKRALALILVFAMAVAYLPMTGIVLKASAAETDITVSFTSVVPEDGTTYTGAPLQNQSRGGYINLAMTCSFENGSGSGYSNMLTADVMQELYDTGYLTVGGGMTIENLKTGLYGFVVATASIYQLNWQNRTEGFPDGSYFTLKQGAALPYVDGSGNANMLLDAEYTFKFKATSNTNYWNEVEITRAMTTTFGMGTAEWGNGLATTTATNRAFTNADGITGFTTKYQRVDNDESYAQYINVAGNDLLTLNTKYGAQIQYILDGSNKLLQFTWGTLRDDLTTGDQIVLKKGLPIAYMVDNVKWIAYLDADYVFQVVGSNDSNTQVFRGLQYDATANTFNLTTGTKSFFSESGIQKANLGFTYTDSTTSLTGPYTNVYAGEMVKDYIEFSSCTLDEVNATGAKLQYIAAAKVLQFEYNDALAAILKTGDTILFKKGMPVIINDTVTTNVLVSATLEYSYQLTMTDTGMEVKRYDEFSATGGSYQLYTEGTTQYVRLQYTTGAFTDMTSGETNLTANNADVYNYISVDGVSGSELQTAGYYLKVYKPTNTFLRLYKGATDFPATSGTQVIFKKGLPVDYTNSDSVAMRVVLDKDYGFEYDGSNWVYDASITWPEASAGLTYGLTTKINTANSGTETPGTYFQSAITGTQVTYPGSGQPWGDVTPTDLSTYVDFSNCVNAEAVKAGTTVRLVIASDTTKLLRVFFNDDALAALCNGDYITLKKGMPITLSTGELTTLDQDYEVNIVSTNEVKVNFTIPAGSFALNGGNANINSEGGKYYAVQYYAETYFADMAAGREVVDFNEIQNHILVTGMDTDALSAAGWDVQMLHSEALQFRIRFTTEPEGEDIAIVLKAGLPVTYITTDGVYKTAHLDKAYGYYYSSTQLTYDSTMTTLPVVVVPEDHTPYMGSYPSGEYDFYQYIANNNFVSGTGNLGVANFSDGNVVVENGIAKFLFTTEDHASARPYVSVNGTAVAGHTYVVSYWIYVSQAKEDLSISPFSSGDSSGVNFQGGPTPTDTNNYLETPGANDDYTINISAPFKTVSSSWQQVVIVWTAQSDGNFEIGLIRNPNGRGSGIVYLDDVMCFDITEPDYTDQGNYAIQIGKWSGTGSNDTDGIFTNLPLTSDSLKDVIMTGTQWTGEINYELYMEDGDFFGLTIDQMKQYGVKLKLIKNTDSGALVLQICWGSSMDFIQPGAQLNLSTGLPVTYSNDGTTYRLLLASDYALLRYVGRDQQSTLMTAVKTDTTPTAGDYDGDGAVGDKDTRLSRLYLCSGFEGLDMTALNADGDANGVINSLDLLCIIKGLDSGVLEDHSMLETIQASNTMADTVQIGYTDNAQTGYSVGNLNMTMTHNLGTAGDGIASLVNKNGLDVLAGVTMTPYASWAGEEFTEKNYSKTLPTRVNTTVLGYYYDSVYFRDMDWQYDDWSLWVEKGLHTYAGKQHMVYRAIAGGDTTAALQDLGEFGVLIKIPVANLNSWEILRDDQPETWTVDDTFTAISGASNIQYIGIDTKNGVFGLIMAGDNMTGSQVDISYDDSTLVIRQYVTISKDLPIGDELQVAHRLYVERADGQIGANPVGDWHSFDGIRAASVVEQTPLGDSNFVIDTNVDGAAFQGYDYATGLYNFKLDGYEFGDAVANPDKKFFAGISVHGSLVDRVVYVCVNTDNPLEGAAVLDKNDSQLPIQLQVNKNFGHENEEPIYNPESTTSSSGDGSNFDYIRGESYMPLVVRQQTTQTFTIVQVMENWGNFRLKQLSSIEYYTPYYHLSTGVTETTCIAPFGTAYRDSGKDSSSAYPGMYSHGIAWLLPDFRGASNDGQYDSSTSENSTVQKNSSGTVFGPTSDMGVTMDLYQGSDVKSSGLTYADIVMHYTDALGRYTYTLRHTEMPQDDESRTYYTVEFTMLKDCTLTQDDFNIMAIGSRGAGTSPDYTKAAYLANGTSHTEISVTQPTLNQSGSWITGYEYSWDTHDATYPLGNGSSYFTFYGLTNSEQENANVGLIVKNFTTTNEAAQAAGLAFYNTWIIPTSWQTGTYTQNANHINYGALVLNGSQTFKADETIKLELVLLSYGKTVQDHCDNVVKVYNDTVVNPFHVSEVTVGSEATLDGYLAVVQSEGNVAEFTVSGGTDLTDSDAVTNYTIKVTGFDRLQKPAIYEKVNGVWQRYRFSSTSQFDGYTVQYESDGTLTYSFVIAKGAEDRTFGISLIEQTERPTLNLSGADLNSFTVQNGTKTLNADGTLTISGTSTESYVYNKGLNLYAPDSQTVTLRVKIDTGTVTSITLGFMGDYLDYDQDGIRQSYADFDGKTITYVSSFGTVDDDGYYNLTINMKKGYNIEWLKITGLRVGFVGSGSITIDKLEIVD